MIIEESQDIAVNNKRRYLRFLLRILPGLIVLAIIIAPIVLIIPEKSEKQVKKKASSTLKPGLQSVDLDVSLEGSTLKPGLQSLDLDDFLELKFTVLKFNATWISDTEMLYIDENIGVLIYNVKTDMKEEIYPSSSKIMKTAFEVTLSPDRQFLLIGNSHNKVAGYNILNLNTKNVSQVKAKRKVRLLFAFWGPVGNSLAFGMGNNIFYMDNAESNDVKIITDDGSIARINNGYTDSIYEEEIFDSTRAAWFSPDGKKLAYAKFNDIDMEDIVLPTYGRPGNMKYQYPVFSSYIYPKTGTTNPVVTLHIADLEDGTTLSLETPSKFGSEAILATVSWANDSKLTAIWMNRTQNEGEIISYNLEKNGTLELIRKVNEPNGWLRLYTPPIFSKNGENMLLIMPQPQKEVGDFMHLSVLENKQDGVTKALTMGGFTVTKILAWDEKHNLIYYTATTEDETPTSQHVYSVSTETKEIKCISCSAINTRGNSSCTHSTADFSREHTYYVLSCNGPAVPEISIYNSTNSKIFTWDNRQEIVEVMKGKQVPVIKIMTFNVTGGFRAIAKIRYPPNIDMSGGTKYPLLIRVHAGPDTHMVAEKFNLDWGSYLTVNKSIIYVSIDGRGSSLKGNKMLFAIYKKLGTVEVADQISVTRKLQEALPYTDPDRTAIWGWGYGGYVSAMALARDISNTFKCGISVAPITDWMLYNTIYTERYMGLPEDNRDAYNQSRLFNYVEGIQGKKYLLIHGTKDYIVHEQHSRLWAKILQKNKILFNEHSYTDEEHYLDSVLPHLYLSMEHFLDDCFGFSNK